MSHRPRTPKIDRLQGKAQLSNRDATSLKASLDDALTALTKAVDSIAQRHHERLTLSASKRSTKRR